MKKLLLSIATLALISSLFLSCTKEKENEQETITLMGTEWATDRYEDANSWPFYGYHLDVIQFVDEGFYRKYSFCEADGGTNRHASDAGLSHSYYGYYVSWPAEGDYHLVENKIIFGDGSTGTIDGNSLRWRGQVYHKQ